MKLNKMTLAVAIAIGIFASTNAGFSEEVINESQNDLVAACPLSGCHKHKKSCNTCKPAKNDNDKCPSLAQCPAPSTPTCGVCQGKKDGKKFEQQVYAYPNAIYGHNQVVGERNNGLYIGDDSTPGFRGIPVAEGNINNDCGCNDGSMTGAAAPLPCLDNAPLGQGISVDRNPNNLDTAGCPVKIQTNTSMEAIKRSIEPFEYNGNLTGGAAPIVSAYEDVPTGYWASCDINKLTCNNILAGYPDGKFKPGTAISRAEMQR